MPEYQPPLPSNPAATSGELHPDPVLSFVGNMMEIMTKFAASYQPTTGHTPARRAQPTDGHESVDQQPQQSKRPRYNSPVMPQVNEASQPAGSNLCAIQPSTQWLGDTQEDLEQQLDQLDNNPMDFIEDDGMTSPFPTTNNSETNEDPLFSIPK